MNKCTAIVLGGGGSHGALQVGALRAILEAGIVPDLLVGTSIGAMNAAGLALLGVDIDGVDNLERTWNEVSNAQILDPRIMQLALRAMAGHPSDRSLKRVVNYLTSLGITQDLCFRMLPWSRLALVSADLKTGQTVIYGQNPDDPVLEGLMMSIAIPPWFLPVQKDGQMIMDGGALSTLPIEPALRMGATEIIALDLDNAASKSKQSLAVAQYFDQYLYALNRRHVYLETALAHAQGVQVRFIDFQGMTKVPIWDFRDSQAMIQSGYEAANRVIDEWTCKDKQNAIIEKEVPVEMPVLSE